MFTGVLIGLVIGLVVAAAMAWYFNSRNGYFKPSEPTPEKSAQAQAATPTKPSSWNETAPLPSPEPAARTKSAPEPAPATPTGTSPGAKPKMDYTFYGILPGNKPAKPIEPPKPKELWWLQIAALKDPADADRLRAKLTLLGLHVTTQKIQSGGDRLYRVRTGPYKREDDAFGDLDTLSANDFEARLLKEPTNP